MSNTVILTHAGADFDAISSAYAAKMLYPNSIVIHPGSTDVNVQKFIGIFSDVLNFKKVRELPKDFIKDVKRVVVVDTKFKNRVGDGREFLNTKNAQIVVFDHHPGESDIENAICINKNFGANTTILVNLLRLKKINLNPVEATILALGIYEDTGSLSFPQVRAEDFKALEFLFSFGVDMKIIHRFTSPFLQEEQVNLLKTFLDNLKEFRVNGYKIGVTTAGIQKYIAGISILAHKILEMIDLDIVFVLVSLGNTVHIIGRSVSEDLNLSKIAEMLGGGGHPTAISAVIEGDIEEAKERIINAINTGDFYTLKAKDIMSAPVKTIPPDTTIKEAFEVMVKMGYSGLPVEENGRITGIIEKKNVEKAFLYNRRNSPVKQFFSTKIVTVSMNTNLREIEDRMVEEDVGRVLVEYNGKIVGIISRSDLLKAYKFEHLVKEMPSKEENVQILDKKYVAKVLTNALDKYTLKKLKEFGHIGKSLSLEIYLVGGAVRDAFMGKRIVDFDFVLSDAIKFGEYLKKHYNGKVEIYYDTQTVHYEEDGLHFDFVTSRREYYLEKSLVPIVEKATLREDLARRDFSINAMAIDISEKNFGALLDFFGGYEDLIKGTIRVLKPLSFIEDPSRILRAIKYMIELNFKLSKETEFLLKKAVDLGVLRSSKSQRIQEELRELLEKDEIEKVLQLFNNFDITGELFRSKCSKSTIVSIKKFFKSEKDKNKRLLALIFLLYFGKKTVDIKEISQIFGIKVRILEKLIKAKDVLSSLKKKSGVLSPYDLAIELNRIDELYIKAFFLKTRGRLKDFLRDYLTRYRQVKIEITGRDLLNLGLKEGAQFRSIFEMLTKLRLKGIIKTKEEEINYILTHRGEFEWR